MIGTLTGVVADIAADHLILNVSGVGYILHVSAKSGGLCCIGQTVKFFIDVHSQKDKPDQLYGFADKSEQYCLRMLAKVNGISYKTAISILSKLTPEQVWSAIANQDKMALKVGGVGAKLVERLIIELRKDVEKMNMPQASVLSEDDDAISALVQLGYESVKAYSLVKKIKTNSPDLAPQDVVRRALKELS